MSPRIRRLERREWQTYRAIRLAALADAPAAFGGTYANAAAYPEQTWRDWCAQPSWFAFEGEEPVGMVRVGSQDAHDLPELISMWVAPQARGTSTAADLVGRVLSWARAEGERGVRLRVIDDNHRARALYERVGFVLNGTRDTLPDGRAEVEMECVFA
ncbi:GNAT family N-acetyltransferase [Luteipulveratus flavus]|uniref:GNAT family N-acetyltransferase n=1 Tax=Luteipulveratus flavus TaxID=3031728 RepID=A0ABT6C4I0_9MICO|nr:GNAT family N-acetyltransferase [Luteipulveratus sp. YIM 133296]MDF8263854.1 GNAT family N-acetyltransferase [Luteipulveratus sp. YIM 133296]